MAAILLSWIMILICILGNIIIISLWQIVERMKPGQESWNLHCNDIIFNNNFEKHATYMICYELGKHIRQILCLYLAGKGTESWPFFV